MFMMHGPKQNFGVRLAYASKIETDIIIQQAVWTVYGGAHERNICVLLAYASNSRTHRSDLAIADGLRICNLPTKGSGADVRMA